MGYHPPSLAVGHQRRRGVGHSYQGHHCRRWCHSPHPQVPHWQEGGRTRCQEGLKSQSQPNGQFAPNNYNTLRTPTTFNQDERFLMYTPDKKNKTTFFLYSILFFIYKHTHTRFVQRKTSLTHTSFVTQNISSQFAHSPCHLMFIKKILRIN